MKPGPKAHAHLIEVEGLNFRPGRVVKEELLCRRAATALGLDHATRTVDIVGIRGAFRGWRYLDLFGTVGPSCGFFVHHGLYYREVRVLLTD